MNGFNPLAAFRNDWQPPGELPHAFRQASSPMDTFNEIAIGYIHGVLRELKRAKQSPRRPPVTWLEELIPRPPFGTIAIGFMAAFGHIRLANLIWYQIVIKSI